MKHAIVGIVFLAALLFGGCATSTIQSRRLERLAAYDALPPETRAFVDQGQIRVGMSADAVYIAWGAPAQILQSESGAGVTTTWLYHETVLRERTRWHYRTVTRGHLVFLERCPEREAEAGSYVSAQITFVNGAVSTWQTLPRPVY
ncbi:MAG: hypothetical protein HZA89_08310 [Verrucomicrobia bacterium]|nr:hypothetical protein [Verrucomicrobiota bacterium]